VTDIQPNLFDDETEPETDGAAPDGIAGDETAGSDGWWDDTALVDEFAPIDEPEDPYRPGEFRLPVDAAVPADLLEGLNDRQRDAVSALAGPVLVVAGPGSGKTRVLTHRIAALLRLGVAPWRVLAVTFTNKAAGEMRDRVAVLVGEEQASQIWMSTFHSMCVKILRRDGSSVGLKRTFAIADADDARRIVRRLLVAEGLEARDATRQADEISSAISLAKNRLWGPEHMAASGDPAMRAAAYYYERYASEMAAQNLVDFDDLLLKTRDLLRTNPDVAGRYRLRFSHVLVDEYQDTNACQYEIVRALVGPDRNLCVVGDHDQAIYQWRGATSEALGAFDSDFPDATVVALDRNYRSTPSIVEVARAVIAPNTAVHRAELWTSNEPGAPVQLRAFGDDRDEARNVVSGIASSIAAGAPPSAHAVLYRTNALSRAVEAELAAQAVPYVVVGGQRFFERAEVKDAMAYLRVLVNDRDQASFTRAASVPRRRLGESTLALIADAARHRDMGLVAAARALHAEGALGRGAKPVEAFLADLDAVAQGAGEGPLGAIEAVLAVPGFVAAATTGASRELAGEARRENLDQLLTAVAEFCVAPPAEVAMALGLRPGESLEPGETLSARDALGAFVEHVALVSAVDVDAADAVQLMTVHSSKGREFPRVWVIGVEDEMFPHSSAGSDSAVAEERRLLFVAVSRAERTLQMSWCARRFRFGELRDCGPSPFLADLPDSVEYTVAPTPSTGGRNDGWARGTARRGSLSGSWAKRPAGGHQRSAVAARAHTGPGTMVRPAADGPRLSPDAVEVGAGVEHVSFGPGTVTDVDATTITVCFADKTRVLMLAHAPLRLAS
jgi:DNA helicase II / ATP-dependent DNA helicase PcrA